LNNLNGALYEKDGVDNFVDVRVPFNAPKRRKERKKNTRP
jgi:hypothetical protein